MTQTITALGGYFIDTDVNDCDGQRIQVYNRTHEQVEADIAQYFTYAPLCIGDVYGSTIDATGWNNPDVNELFCIVLNDANKSGTYTLYIYHEGNLTFSFPVNLEIGWSGFWYAGNGEVPGNGNYQVDIRDPDGITVATRTFTLINYPEPPVDFRIRVLDDVTLQPISNAYVDLTIGSDYTDANGYTQWWTVESGVLITGTITASGYDNGTVSITPIATQTSNQYLVPEATTCNQQFTLIDYDTGAYITGATVEVGGIPCTEHPLIERYQIDNLTEGSWYNVVASKSGYTCPSDICKDTFQACGSAIVLKLKSPSTPITCNGATPNFPYPETGCDLLLFFDTDNDGIISATERDDAWEAEFLGHITHEEAQFVEDAYNAGSINALCPGCFVTPSLSISPTAHSSPLVGDSFAISITSNIAWTVSDDMPWIQYTPSSGSDNDNITITVDENLGTDVRTGNVFVTGEGITRRCTVTQAGSMPEFDAAITDHQPPTSLYMGDDVHIPTTIENRGCAGNFRVFLTDNDTGLEIDHKPTDTWKHLSGDSITITFVIFGDPLAYGAIPNNQIIEFLEFLRANTDVEIITEIKSYAEVPDPSYWSDEYESPCYLLAPWNIPDSIKEELTGDVVFLLWNTGDKEVCLGGGTWGPESGINGSPVCSIAFNKWWFAEPYETFDYHGAFIMAFEFCNAGASIANYSGTTFPSPEACPSGKTLTECLQWCLEYLPNVAFGGIYNATMEGIMPDKDWNLMISVREESTGDLDTKEFIINKLEGGIGIIESYSAPAELEEGEELTVSFIAKNIGTDHGILGGFKMHLWIDATKYDVEPDLSWKSLANNETWEDEVNTIGSIPAWSMPNHDVNVSIILEDKYEGIIATEEFVVAIKSVVCSDYTDETSCINAGCFWHDNTCHDYGPVQCSDYTDAITCVSNNCYWWSDGTCHDTKEPSGLHIKSCTPTEFPNDIYSGISPLSIETVVQNDSAETTEVKLKLTFLEGGKLCDEIPEAWWENINAGNSWTANLTFPTFRCPATYLEDIWARVELWEQDKGERTDSVDIKIGEPSAPPPNGEEGLLASIIAMLMDLLNITESQAKLIVYGGGGLLAMSFIMPMLRR